MKLAPVSLIETAISADAMANVQAAIADALNSATSEIAGVLRTDFERVSKVDDFMIRAGTVTRPMANAYKFHLALTRGFLTEQPTITYSATLAGLTSDPEILSADNWQANLDKGSITVLTQIDLRNYFVRVEYTAGFSPDGDDADLYDQTQVPDWLRDGAKAYGLASLLAYRPELLGDENARDPKDMRKNANTALERHIRYFPAAMRPFS